MLKTYFPQVEIEARPPKSRGGAPAPPQPVLLLMAYECMPDRGSEAFVGWGRVLQAAREFEVHVIVSSESYAAIASYLESNPMPGTVFFYTPAEDRIYRLLLRLPRLFQYHYLAYGRWQKLAFKLARELHRQHSFALVHHVNVCTFREPGYTWRLGIPYIWGPVGGTQNFPPSFLAGLPLAERLKERVRNSVNWLSLRLKPRVRKAARSASLVIAANSENRRDYEAVFHRPVELLLETGLYGVFPPEPLKFLAPGPLHILWSGEFTTRKALPLLLEALATLPQLNFQLRILGRGPREAEWKNLTRKLGLEDCCTFLGHQPLAEAIGQLDWAQLFVFTSLRDTSGNVVLEALAHGIPVVCFDHQGVGDIVTSACGIKIPVAHPKHAVTAFAGSIRALADDRARLAQLSAAATTRARAYLWSENGARINSIYRDLALAAPARP